MVRTVPLVKGILGISASTRPPRKAAAPSRTVGSASTIRANPRRPTSAPTSPQPLATSIRPFTVPVTPKAELEALRARVRATRWPDQELVADHSQGPKLAVMHELARYWAGEYNWRRCEANWPRCRTSDHKMKKAQCPCVPWGYAPVSCRTA
jgi:Epoxide hydrolase N terminus